MFELSLKTQEQMLKGISFMGEIVKNDDPFWGNATQRKLIMMQDMGDGIYGCFCGLNYSGEDLHPIGFLIPEKKLIVFPYTELRLATDYAGNSILHISEEKHSFSELSSVLLRQIIEILFDPDGNPNEDELRDLPGGTETISPTKPMIHLIVGDLFHAQMCENVPESFADWVLSFFYLIENTRDYAALNISKTSIVAEIDRISLPSEVAVKLLFLEDKTSPLLYQTFKAMSSRGLVRELQILSTLYRRAKTILRKTSKKELEQLMAFYTVIDEECKEFPGKSIKIETKTGDIHRQMASSILMHLSPAGIVSVSDRPLVIKWKDIHRVKIGNKIIYRG